MKKVADAMVQAVKAKIISKEKLDASVKRILALKKQYKLEGQKPLGEAAILADVATKDNHELAEKIAGLALKICYQQNQPISLRDKSIAIIAPSIIENALLKTAIHKVGKSQTHLFMATVSPSEEERKRALKIVQEADVALVFSSNAWKTPSQLSMIQELTKYGKLIVLVALRDPQDAKLFETVALTMTTCSPSPSSINVVIKELLNLN